MKSSAYTIYTLLFAQSRYMLLHFVLFRKIFDKALMEERKLIKHETIIFIIILKIF